MTRLRVISIGALPAHPLWNERAPVRTGHATTTLVRQDDAVILIDPGLPGEIIAARLSERAGIAPSDVTHVFLTSFKPDVWRGVEAFTEAVWLIHEPEREAIGVSLIAQLKRADEADDRELVEMFRKDIAVLKRCVPAPDQLAKDIDLFPLPGVTQGLCGLIVCSSSDTTVICGDAIPTVEHLEQGKVLPTCADIALAQASLMEAVEIADQLVLGRDNMVSNPSRRPF